MLGLGEDEHTSLEQPITDSDSTLDLKSMAQLAKHNEERFINLAKHSTTQCSLNENSTKDASVQRIINNNMLGELTQKTKDLFIEQQMGEFQIPVKNPSKQLKTLKQFFKRQCKFLTISKKANGGNVSFILWDNKKEVLKFSSRDK